MLLDGQPLKVNGPKDAMNMGLTAIYQELNVIPKLTVWGKYILGRELRNKRTIRYSSNERTCERTVTAVAAKH